MKRKTKVAILLQMSQNFDQGVFRGIAAFARESGSWSLFVEQEQGSWTSVLEEPGVSGMIVNLDSDVFAREALRRKIPIVGIGGGGGHYRPESGMPYVTTDNVAIGRMAADHLMETGLRHFGFCGFRPTRNLDWTAVREAAFRDRLRECGFDCEVFHGTSAAGTRAALTQREIGRWLRSLRRPVGVMACYDWRARHVLEACHATGLRVPDDVALVGVDNDSMLCELTDPPLTSIEQNRAGIGHAAAAMLDQCLKGRRGKRQPCVLPPIGVIARQSTNLVAVADPRIAAILRVIRDHACGGLTTERAASQAGVSRATLDNWLKHSIGRTADAEIRRVRMAMADQLLIQTSMTLRDVALQSGWGNEQYLCALWRKHKGLTPGQYRAAHRTVG